MPALQPALGWVDYSLLTERRPDPWGFRDIATRLRELAGNGIDRIAPAIDPDDAWEVRMCRWISEMCTAAFAFEGGAIGLAIPVRRFALAHSVAPADPIDLSLFALCAFVTESGRTTLPPKDRADAILTWYLNDFLPGRPSEVSPAHLKRLLRGTGARREDWYSAAGIRKPPQLVAARPAGGRSAARRLSSGDHVWFRQGGNGEQYLLPGDWNELEPDHIWSKPHSGFIVFELAGELGDECLLELDLTIPNWPCPLAERCVVTLNRQTIAVIRDPGHHAIRLLLPAYALNPGHNDLGLHAPLFAPRNFGSADHRELGTAISRMRICLNV